MEVAAGVHRLTKGVVNWYVIEDAGKLTVVDAGTPADWNLLVETVGRLRHRLADIDAVLITHAHADHTGFEVLDVPGRPRVVHAPGHTAGHGEPWTQGVAEGVPAAQAAGVS